MTNDLPDVLPQTTTVINEGITRGLQRGVQLSISHDGAVIAEGAVGTSHDSVPLTSDTLMPWLSAGKPLTAVCVLRLVEAGRLTLETPVADVIPEFAQTSPDVTTAHLLTHTAGLQPIETGWPRTTWDERVTRICQAGLQSGWIPGERAAYDPRQSWILLGEMVRRIDGRPIEQIVRDDVMIPLGMQDSWMAMPHEVWKQYGDRIGRTDTVKGRERNPTEGHTAMACASPSPGASCRGPIRELRLFYEMLLAGGVTAEGKRLLNPATVALMSERHRAGMFDETFRHTLDFGLGLIINSNRYGGDTVPYGYGENASAETFGHGGSRSCIAFADPQRQLVVCVVANGYPSEPQHQRRMRQILAAIDNDLNTHTL